MQNLKGDPETMTLHWFRRTVGRCLLPLVCLVLIATTMLPKATHNIQPSITSSSVPVIDVAGSEPGRTLHKNMDPPKKGLKYILMYTPYFKVKDWGFGTGHEPFVRHNCQVQNCLVTNNASYLPNYSDYDAILFHIRDLSHIPNWLQRRPNQVYVMFLMESPANSANFPYRKHNGKFNWTMTYRRDSDIQSRYGWVVPIDTPWSGPLDIDFKQQLDGVADTTGALEDLVKAKKKTVAWIVSNCNTHSQREDYVKELTKHIDVDIYGNCGKYQCQESRASGSPASCINQIHKTYKFYLSFENSWCQDYVTEKFWNALNSSMIPVVLGGADYASIAPPNSFVDASKYKPKELAAILKNMKDSELISRLAWKTRYIVSKSNINHQRMCDLCKKLNEPELKKKVYNNIYGWWVGDGDCKKKGWSQ